jgi:tetratricopeptide (TPR) repeat protein
MKNNILKYLILIILIFCNINLFAQFDIIKNNAIHKVIKFDKQNDLDNALIFLNKKINKDSKNDIYYSYRSYIHFIKEDYNAALNDVNQCIKLQPSNIAYSLYKSEIQFENNDFNEAFKLLDVISKHSVVRIQATLKKIYFHRQLSNFDTAIALCNQIINAHIKEYSDNAQNKFLIKTYNHLSLTYLKLYQLDSALYYSNKILEYDSISNEYLLNNAKILMKMGNEEQCKAKLKQILSKENNSLYFANAYAYLGMKEKAKEVLDCYISKYFNNYKYDIFHIASIYSILVENDKAFKYLDKIQGKIRKSYLINNNDFDNIKEDERFVVFKNTLK